MDVLDKPLINRVAESGLITLNLEDYFPKQALAVFDLKDYLFMGLILKEKDFREACKAHDWTQYAGKNLVIDCTADAIIPDWRICLCPCMLPRLLSKFFKALKRSFTRHFTQQNSPILTPRLLKGNALS